MSEASQALQKIARLVILDIFGYIQQMALFLGSSDTVMNELVWTRHVPYCVFNTF